MKNHNEFLYEGKGFPNDIKEIVEYISEIIKEIKIGNKYRYKIDLSKWWRNIEIKLNIDIKHNNINSYNGNINYIDAINSNFKNIKINVNIYTDILDMIELKSILYHELLHLYELYKINGMIENTSWNLNSKLIDFKNEYNNLGTFKYFIDLVYLSFDHEIRARIAQIYDFLYTKNTINKTELLEILKSSKSYRSYLNMMNFEYKKLIDSYEDKKVLINFINLLNHKFDINTKIKSEKDLQNYFKKWNFHFKDSAKKYHKKLLKVVDEVIKDKSEIKEQEIYCTQVDICIPAFFNKRDKILVHNNIKQFLKQNLELEIYKTKTI